MTDPRLVLNDSQNTSLTQYVTMLFKDDGDIKAVFWIAGLIMHSMYYIILSNVIIVCLCDGNTIIIFSQQIKYKMHSITKNSEQ